MKPHLIPGQKPLHTAPLLNAGALPGRLHHGFYGAPMLMRGIAASHAAANNTYRINHVYRQLNISNSLLLHVTLWRDAALRVRAPLSAVTLRRDFVNETLDEALRAQLERELEVMERGENVAANQRRRRMLRRALERKPQQTIRRFYGVQMRLLASGAAGTAKPQEGFFSDIVRERTVSNTETVHTHTSAQTIVVRQDAAPANAQVLRQLTEQVAQRLEERARRRRDTAGIW